MCSSDLAAEQGPVGRREEDGRGRSIAGRKEEHDGGERLAGPEGSQGAGVEGLWW